MREARQRLIQDLLNGVEPGPNAFEEPSEAVEENSRFKSVTLQTIVSTVEQVGSRSTIHGLLHIFHSKELFRRLFWLVLLLTAASLGLAHMYITAQKFLSNPVSSQLRLMSEKVTFPDITLCNLKPASESIALAPEFRQYMRDKWGHFDGWYVNERKRLPNESKVNFYERARLVFGRLFQVLWVSGDSRDLGVMDETLQLDCSYNGIKCHSKNFSLVQNFRFWNCYTFYVHADSSVTGIGGRGAELDILAFTDAHNTVRLEDLDRSVNDFNDSGGIYDRSRQTEEQVPISLQSFLNEATGLNHLLTEGSYIPGGFRVFIHEKKLYPFTVDTSELCYYVPPSHWTSPPEQVLNKISCHDRWISEVEKRTYELIQQFQSRRSCEFTLYRPWEQSSRWPHFEDVPEIWHDFIAPKIATGDEFTINCDHQHHIFNRTETAAFNRSTSREELLYYPMLLTDKLCLEYFCNGTGSACNLPLLRHRFVRAGACVEQSVMAKNVARIRVQLKSSAADAYVESLSYEWTEALSETGGILGLWLGVSVLSLLELLEFFYILARNCCNQRLSPIDPSRRAAD